ncbi:peritrophin-44-like isoform X3 [Schistocerca nitens]|uniref:peritrophin-44-like isoform X3 n=1 Tax=Schistocerca nitens TaxID=7011 RepID=UPI00211766AA|nr:peritrophin-44-like isoform X3 [Schistocerca nitens]
MAGDKTVGLRVLAMMALAALPELACCQLAGSKALSVVFCGAEGRFPDPTDCGYYMDCTSNGDGSYTQTITPCPAGTYYNSCQGNCSLTQQPPNCSFLCSINGAITISPENPSVYFVCIINATGSYFNVSKCDNCNISVSCPVNNSTGGGSSCNGTYYYGDEKNCSVFYHCGGVGATPDLGECSSDQYYLSYNHSCVEFRCTSEGWFADPANCSRYYYCSRDGSGYVKTHVVCPDGSHFDSSVGGCMMGLCTTVCPGSSSSDFRCPSSGFFADPLSCSSYYYCDSNLEATHVVCPDGSHFDSVVGGCMMGSCSKRMV